MARREKKFKLPKLKIRDCFLVISALALLLTLKTEWYGKGIEHAKLWGVMMCVISTYALCSEFIPEIISDCKKLRKSISKSKRR